MSTISDVAKKAGVSIVTVSRVINGAHNVNPSTREKVELAIAELDYVPSVAARSLRSKQTYSLALIVPDVTNPFWTTVARGVEDAAQSEGYSILLCNTDESAVKQQRYLDVVLRQRVDGVIIAPFDSDAGNLAKLRERNIPTVIIDRRIEGWQVDSVIGDSLSGARAVVQHLIGLGHRQIAAISGPFNTSTAEDRIAGYCIAMHEAGLPLDPGLIKRGEYRNSSGERLTHQLFDEGLNPTAIFAANNAIAAGVIEALAKRGLRVPLDVALVCFDESPDVSRFFPFLTAVVQPAYDMGLNAAQLLLSRMTAKVPLRPRQVLLPTRLSLRYSCGRTLQNRNDCVFALPLPQPVPAKDMLVKTYTVTDPCDFSALAGGISLSFLRQEEQTLELDKPDVNRLLKAFRHQEPDRVPHLEISITNRKVYEYVLERALEHDDMGSRLAGLDITPEDQIELAQRLGMDAVPCNFVWRPNNVFNRGADGLPHYMGGTIKNWDDLDRLEPPLPLTEQFGYLERYLRAAQGTGVGVFASFTSFFESALLAVGLTDALYMFYDNRPFLERLMDILLEHQEKVIQSVCSRFASDLAFVLISDNVAHSNGLLINPEMFQEIFVPRMLRLIAPAKEHGKLLAIHTEGRVDRVLPVLSEIGFQCVHPVEPELNDIFDLKSRWTGQLALMGNIPTALLAYGNRDQIEKKVQEYCLHLAPGGGYVLGSSTGILVGIPPENFVAMTKAVHRYGRYGALGSEY